MLKAISQIVVSHRLSARSQNDATKSFENNKVIKMVPAIRSPDRPITGSPDHPMFLATELSKISGSLFPLGEPT